MNATFLTTVPEETLPVKVSAEYEGPVPQETCDYLANRIIDRAASGSLYPAQPMDVYMAVWQSIERTARNMPKLEVAAKKTYLHRAVDRALSKQFTRFVKRMRDEYRTLEGRLERTENAQANKECRECPEGNDAGYANYASAIEGYDYSTGKSADQQLTAQQLAERLPSTPGAHERQQKAAARLEEIYKALTLADHKVAVCAFRAYVEADGNMFAAARIAGIGKSTFYALWPYWLEVAKLCSEKKGI